MRHIFAGNLADMYENILVPSLFAPWTEVILDFLAATSPRNLLDVACGTGVVARRARKHFNDLSKVTGIDISEDMLIVARSNDKTIEWCQGDALDLPFKSEVYDAVGCQQGLQFFSDRERALREMHRVLVPGGRIVLATWAPLENCPAYLALHEAAARREWTDTTAVLELSFSLYGSTLTDLVEHTGFIEVEHRDRMIPLEFKSTEAFVHFYGAVSPLLHDWSGASASERKEVVAEVREQLVDWESGEGLRAPMVASLVSAVRVA